MKRFSILPRVAIGFGLFVLCQEMVLAQGTSPWVDAVNELQTQFTGPIGQDRGASEGNGNEPAVGGGIARPARLHPVRAWWACRREENRPREAEMRKES